MVRISDVSKDWMEGVPVVTLSGSWLHDFGFEIGSKVVIDAVKGEIVIKLVDAED